MPNAVSAYKLPSASPLTINWPNGRSSIVHLSVPALCGIRLLDKCRDAGDFAPHDEHVNFVRTFVGIDCFHVGKMARNLMLEQHPVAAQRFARERHHLARLGCA